MFKILLLITYNHCLFLAENIHLSGQKWEIIENRILFQLLAQYYGIIIIIW